MDVHAKREVLEIFNMNTKNVLAGFLSLNWPPTGQLSTISRKMVA